MIADDPTAETLWSERAARCVIVPESSGIAVELRNDQGSPFLRKKAATRIAARNDGEYLRLVWQREPQTPDGGIKPFALVMPTPSRYQAAS